MDSQIVAVSHPRVGTGASVVADDDARNIHTAALKLGARNSVPYPQKEGPYPSHRVHATPAVVGGLA